MILYPAIDLIDGKCVRLFKGDFEQKTTYDVSPFEVLETYKSEGTEWVHIVDLDGAKDSANRQSDLMREIAQKSGLKIQTGGGIRSREDVSTLLDLGVSRIVIGSMAVQDIEETKEIIQDFGPDKICIAMDVLPRDDEYYVAVHGWQEGSDVLLEDLVRDYQGVGLKHVLCTDISKDGTMTGCNFDLYEALNEKFPDIEFQASGGVHALEDLKKLNTSGVIVGKALYENVFTVQDALQVMTGNS
ncbi:MAG: 1-(5-phosphoribosyl)-5-[(5-phosphoribosylamino)methylideneamino]imidazole-4-carboxamide isomerase [Pseudomonadota bacterium]